MCQGLGPKNTMKLRKSTVMLATMIILMTIIIIIIIIILTILTILNTSIIEFASFQTGSGPFIAPAGCKHGNCNRTSVYTARFETKSRVSGTHEQTLNRRESVYTARFENRRETVSKPVVNSIELY